MSSSDSDDDCYGNVAQKLQSLKNKYVQDELKDVILSDSSKHIKSGKITKNDDITSTIVLEDCNTTFNSTDNDEMTLDAIIAKNTKSKPGRKRKSDEEPFEPIYEGVKRPSRRKTANSRGLRRNEENSTDKNEIPVVESCPEPARRGRRSRGGSNTAAEDNAPARGTGRGNRRGATPSRRRGRGRNSRQSNNRPIMSALYPMYPTYSIGNTDEYPDMCDHQELFSATKSNDVEIIEDEDPLEDNEELSVKVYWQNLEVVRFKIRKYQKITAIFKYFSEKENVGYDKLLFMYNDKILKVDDTPDSIDYNIAKFIDGGIVNQDVSDLVKQNNKESKGGLKLKFQCQNLKKPFETTIRPEDKLALALMKCAEHIEMPLERLKFYFDGDLISGKNTPQELDLEGGECIDVKIVS